MHPILLHLGPLALPTFGALLALGLLAALLLSQRTALLVHLPPALLWDAGLFAIVAAFVCSRALLVAGHWHTFLRFPLLLLAVPSLNAAGLALTLAATLIFLWVRRVPPLCALEAWTPPGLLVWGVLALGHFAEGSDPGMPTHALWGVHLPGDPAAQEPVALLAALAAFALAAVTYGLLRQGLPAAWAGLAGAGIAQVLLSFMRQPAPETVWGMDPLEWVGVALTMAGGGLLIYRAAARRPGRTCA